MRCKEMFEKQDKANKAVLQNLAATDLTEESKYNQLICHKVYYASFTSKSHITRVQKNKIAPRRKRTDKKK